MNAGTGTARARVKQKDELQQLLTSTTQMVTDMQPFLFTEKLRDMERDLKSLAKICSDVIAGRKTQNAK